MKIFSFSPFGYEGALVSVEVDLRRGIPAVDMVGLADGAVKESRERMRSAIRNSGFDFPPERVLISLSPADLKKEGAGFDLAIALAVLSAQNENSEENKPLIDEKILIMGELELSGKIRAVRGVHGAVSTALEAGISMCIVPEDNRAEAMQADRIKVFGARNLKDAYSALFKRELFLENQDFSLEGLNDNDEYENIDGVLFPKVERSLDFIDIEGQERLTRALQIAAGGHHNLITYGSPGCGKTLSLQRYISLLPCLTLEEAQSVTRIHSIAGLLPQGKSLIRKPQFRQPHQTASIEGMCGGGARCMPGEISLSHNGVLFLDEAAEFKTSVLQMLRVPLESGAITISRAGRSTSYPARFQLLLATNPCPCGFYGSKEKICLCSASSVEQYWKKFSGPLLDRIDIRVKAEEFKSKSVSSSELRKDIARATRVQRERQNKYNAYLTPEEVEKYCILSEEARKLLSTETIRHTFSSRAEAACKKLSRTIADMRGSSVIEKEDMQEAIELRKDEGALYTDF